MLTPYAGCWGSFALRGLSLVLFGVVQLALPGMAAESTIPMLGIVLLVSGANAASLGLRLRPSGAASWLLLLEGGVSLLTGAATFARPQSSVLAAAGPVAVLAALNGACQLGLAWRARSGPYGAWPIAGAGLAWTGFALMLAWQPFAAPEQAMATSGAAGLILGAVLSAVAVQLRQVQRLARHELLRDAPLAHRTVVQRAASTRPTDRCQAAEPRTPAPFHAT